jgi:hypothetical protein
MNVETYLFRDDGITLNTDAVAPFVDITSVQGLDSAPLRTTTKDHEGTDGGFVDAELETLRTVVLEGVVYSDPTRHDAYLEALKANFEPNTDPQPLYYGLDSGDRVVFGKSQGLKYNKTNERSYGKQEFNVTVICGDPRIYSPTVVSSGKIYLSAATSGGRGYPKGFPFGYGAAVTQSSGSITPGGTRSTPGWYVITGPIINPIIVNDTTGQQWTFTTSLAAGEQLWINPRIKTVRLGENGPSRRKTLKGLWWFLQKGQNTFRLQGSGGTAGVTNLEIFARPAWR